MSSRNNKVGRGSRSLRQKTTDKKAQYLDGLESDSDEDPGGQAFDVLDKLDSQKFAQFFVKELPGEEVNLAYFQR